jgi:hypothetical protein
MASTIQTHTKICTTPSRPFFSVLCLGLEDELGGAGEWEWDGSGPAATRAAAKAPSSIPALQEMAGSGDPQFDAVFRADVRGLMERMGEVLGGGERDGGWVGVGWLVCVCCLWWCGGVVVVVVGEV